MCQSNEGMMHGHISRELYACNLKLFVLYFDYASIIPQKIEKVDILYIANQSLASTQCKLLPQLKNNDDSFIHESRSNTVAEFLCEDVSVGVYSLQLNKNKFHEQLYKTINADKRREVWTAQIRVNAEGCDDDGYSWRKYGQKEILGAKYPRLVKSSFLI